MIQRIIPFIFILSSVLCQSRVEFDRLIRFEGIWYLQGSIKPFSGVAYVLSKNSRKKTQESKYFKGQLHGAHTEWWENGKRKRHGRYNSGKRHGRWVEYHENGNIMSDENYKQGIKDGPSTEWHDDGIKHSKGEYVNGERIGPWQYWDKNGRPIQYACIKTRFGEIIIDLFYDEAPMHVENFKGHVRSGYYDGTTFHRVIPDFVIQGGDPNSLSTNRKTHGKGGEASSFFGIGDRREPSSWRVPAEFNDMRHERGIVSMARGPERDSAGSQFFICVKDSPNLDERYTIFAKVLEGMKIVDQIVNTPVDNRDNPIDRIEMEIYICN
jgi:peptidyl-prolyl cis-trans isomerase B (cyclophilin B)